MEKKYLTFVCFNQKMAGYLMMKGFKLHEIKPNDKYPEKNVFLFTNSSELEKAITEFRKQKEKGIFII
ncbi:DUF5659 domain-containing protein [Desulfotomaculum nigrificans]|uniref:DUF5659 domain-containing protein n=1 Tax=Desulfotomaculum nigrificans TaxID=1565 RepID=UPI0001FAECE0|nr:DUF5659 domain-containing protein [Desulfotomaculum nigrificans]